MKADLVVYDKNGQIAIIVEIKKKTGASVDWARKWRRNILAHGSIPDVKFFLIALPDRFYLWKDTASIPEPTTPTFDIDARPLLKPYLQKIDTPLQNISGQSFELVVSAWLTSILQNEQAFNKQNNSLNWIKTSGLFETIRGGHLKHEVIL